jgi:hypothetical protein
MNIKAGYAVLMKILILLLFISMPCFASGNSKICQEALVEASEQARFSAAEIVGFKKDQLDSLFKNIPGYVVSFVMPSTGVLHVLCVIDHEPSEAEWAFANQFIRNLHLPIRVKISIDKSREFKINI